LIPRRRQLIAETNGGGFMNRRKAKSNMMDGEKFNVLDYFIKVVIVNAVIKALLPKKGKDPGKRKGKR